MQGIGSAGALAVALGSFGRCFGMLKATMKEGHMKPLTPAVESIVTLVLHAVMSGLVYMSHTGVYCNHRLLFALTFGMGYLDLSLRCIVAGLCNLQIPVFLKTHFPLHCFALLVALGDEQWARLVATLGGLGGFQEA